MDRRQSRCDVGGRTFGDSFSGVGFEWDLQGADCRLYV